LDEGRKKPTFTFRHLIGRCDSLHFIRFSRLNADDFSQSRDSPVHVEQLDTQITIEEISKTISSLNKNKSAEYQNIVTDFFIDANYFISKYLCKSVLIKCLS
jgi:hypothetical protein